MAGQVVRVVPKTFVTFSNIPFGTVNASTIIWLARRVNVANWREITLLIRCHSGTSITAAQAWAQTPTIQVYADGYTDEDPSVFGQMTSGNVATGFVVQLGSNKDLLITTVAGQAAPNMVKFDAPANAGGLIAIGVAARQATATAANTADIYLSIDMTGKE